MLLGCSASASSTSSSSNASQAEKASSPKIDRDLNKSRWMMAAMSVLRMPSAALYAGNLVDLPEGGASPNKQSSMSKINMQSNLLRSTSERLITGAKSFVRTLGPTHVGTLVGSMIRSQALLDSAASAVGQPGWEAERNEGDEISPDMALAAAKKVTVVVAAAADGTSLSLPYQVVIEGKTAACLPYNEEARLKAGGGWGGLGVITTDGVPAEKQIMDLRLGQLKPLLPHFLIAALKCIQRDKALVKHAWGSRGRGRRGCGRRSTAVLTQVDDEEEMLKESDTSNTEREEEEDDEGLLMEGLVRSRPQRSVRIKRFGQAEEVRGRGGGGR
ncbi:hypothetical protein CEUSTIGMA_g6299.t1 [Chlamydomonas eustigma]|uniref:Uncharacterized protein n=1 Tax=Chlamydomonas eustigma TaxID=1157962 RepID=A0A250X702_9CHLO|nr:hypothetical protein CEUSTIGMA_g6299.t1 [Chlamydomonas eustigma]|eukprot:GAX78861.1 hypothetical protein CEUSTIGMA_g6299.t1 [Chlamydomonas eustigma]